MNETENTSTNVTEPMVTPPFLLDETKTRYGLS